MTEITMINIKYNADIVIIIISIIIISNAHKK